MSDLTQWSTVTPYIGAYPIWAGEENQARIAAYAAYESMYWNVPEAFKLIQRGTDAKPIYIPKARQIVETMHRYLCPQETVIADPLFGTDGERAKAMEAMIPFMRRERLLSKLSMNKRYGLIRGDSLFHIYADPELPEGSRISIEAIDPGSYFPIYNEEDGVTIIGCHLVDQVKDDQGEFKILRQTYRKTTGLGGPSPITVEEAIFETDAWGGPNMEERRVEMVRPVEQLDARITSIPVYHFPNAEEPGTRWGSSEIRGIESMIAHINQAISDEELELVLNGLGVYVTDAGSPINEDTGEPEAWNLGPAKVIELPSGKKFERVNSTATVAPYQEHLSYLGKELDLSVGQSDAARGKVDVAVAESGISLALQLAPIFARAGEKELILTDIKIQMYFDLKAWFEVYEGIGTGAALWIPAYGSRLPQNRKERFEEIMAMFAGKLVSGKYARSELRKIGYDTLPEKDEDMLNEIMEETIAVGTAESDVTGARMDKDLSEGEGATDGGTG